MINKWMKAALGLWIMCQLTVGFAQQMSNEPEFQTVSPLMASNSTGDYNANTTPPTQLVSPPIQDPWEHFNRKIFTFNDTLDTYVFVPVAKTYNKIMPKPLNRGVYNFFANLNNFPTISNDLLQGNFYQATSDSWRFIINSTAGAGGLFDVAQNMGLEPNAEDFGLTLARWGYTNSNYLVIPFFGPSTMRDALGMPIDYFFFNIYTYTVPDMRTQYTLFVFNMISKRAHLLQYQDFYNQFALDRYTFIRNAYIQQRANAIERNQQLSDPYFKLTSRSQTVPSMTT